MYDLFLVTFFYIEHKFVSWIKKLKANDEINFTLFYFDFDIFFFTENRKIFSLFAKSANR